jgi:hypothetical protein
MMKNILRHKAENSMSLQYRFPKYGIDIFLIDPGS